MLSALFALIGAFVYGASDFVGGLAARRMPAIRVTAINSVAALAVLGVAYAIAGGRWSSASLLWGGLAGIVGAAAIALLYACLAIGPMSILAPIMALVSAVIPIGIGFARGESLTVFGYLGLAIGLVAIVMVCFVPGGKRVKPSTRGVLLAVAAGVAIGLYLTFIDLSPSDSGLTPLIIVFAVGAVITWPVALIIARRRSPAAPDLNPWWRGGVALALWSGATDATASVLFLVALRLGDLSVVSVLNGLSTAGTILLAAIFLRERISIVQWFGLAAALVAAALLALA